MLDTMTASLLVELVRAQGPKTAAQLGVDTPAWTPRFRELHDLGYVEFDARGRWTATDAGRAQVTL